MTRRPFASVLLLAAVSALLVACGDGEGEGEDETGSVNCETRPEGDAEELIYLARPFPPEIAVGEEELAQASELLCERVQTIGAEDAQVSVRPEDEISVVLPANIDPALVDGLGEAGRLFFYDWEANLVPNRDTPASQPKGEAGFARLYDAVQLASEQQPESDEKCADTCTFAGERFYLFDENSLEPLAGPVAEESDLYNPASGNEPGSGVVLAVPQGTVVVAEPVVDDSGRQTGDEYFVLHDDPALTGAETANAELGTDPATNQPNVSFDFTETGQASWASLTREVAERGRAEAPPLVATDQQAVAVSQHIALVLDTLVVTRPIINFVSNPVGIDGSTGAQISGSLTAEEAQRLASILQIGPLPVELTLESQEPVN